MSAYKSQNGNYYRFKNPKHKFSVPGIQGEFKAYEAINNSKVMERLINLNSPSLVVVPKASNGQGKNDNSNASKTKNLSAPELIALVNESESVEAINELVSADEDRKTVLAAVDKKIEALNKAATEAENSENTDPGEGEGE